MARSSYIYVVLSARTGAVTIQAAFTVKYEMMNWLDSQSTADKAWFNVYRIGDGAYKPNAVEITDDVFPIQIF